MLLKHICHRVLSAGTAVSAALVAGVSLGPSCRQVTGPEFLCQLDTIFSIYITAMDWHWDSVQCAVLDLCE